MKKRHPLLWIVPLILMLLLLPFVVPSALPYAGAESAELPVFTPVELANPNPENSLLPLPTAKDPAPSPYMPHPDGYVYDEETGAAWEYRDGTLYVKIERRRFPNATVSFTWIQIAEASQLRTHVSRETNPVREAKKIGAVLAINGDWYSGRPNIGVIYRNGVQMRNPRNFDNYDMLIIDDEGDFHIIGRPNTRMEAFAPYEGSIMHSFLFGPALVIDGQMQVITDNNYGSGPGMGLMKAAQRQAICQMGPLTYLIVTAEGPDGSLNNGGLTVPEMAQLCYDMGAVNAYNLDGGNSASLILNNTKMNRFGKGAPREVTDLVYFITAEPAPVPTDTPVPEDYAPPEETAVPAP